MSALRARSSRLVWSWCLVYTALAFGEARRRRRAEILSHLWESERAGVRARAVVLAAAKGVVADVGWAAGSTGRLAGRGARDPGVHLAGAVLLTVQAAFLWNSASAHTTHLAEAVSTGVAGLLVVVAGVCHVAGRRSG
jgi:hypothetical protein